jgi:SAM-dependent methyltransferase
MTSSDAGGADPMVSALYDAFSPAVEEAMLAVIRELALATPAPGNDPFYGLDRLGGASLRLLDRLTRHGDFRKYVTVLDAGAGLGGAARWLARRYGCRVVALDVCLRLVAAGARLSRRARVAARVHGVAGSFEAVPARDGTFTQIWSVEALHQARDRRRALAELFRVLRPGCTLALQEIVRRSAAVPTLDAPWRHGTVDEHLDALDAAGFQHVLHEDVTAERPETSSLVASARRHLDRTLASDLPADDAWHHAAAAVRRVEAIVAGPEYRVVHFFGRRPGI